MKALILAVLLAVAQALFPVPGNTAKDNAHGSYSAKKPSNDHKDVPAPTPIQSTVSPASSQRDGSHETAEEKQQHVIVDRLPDKDGWDKFYICLTAALTAIAAFTLGAIWYQAIQTKKGLYSRICG
jgi:hypothetical protein